MHNRQTESYAYSRADIVCLSMCLYLFTASNDISAGLIESSFKNTLIIYLLSSLSTRSHCSISLVLSNLAAFKQLYTAKHDRVNTVFAVIIQKKPKYALFR